jgi:trafficking protein particle complex subunit 11
MLILLGDGDISVTELEDRLANVRRATGLDARSIHFLAHDLSRPQIDGVVNTILAPVHASSIEYYRDLSKHARRKRNRSAVPQPTIDPGTSKVLSPQGWNVRYEFKLGILAEFRQEMDAAGRNYETAYESLFTPELMGNIAPMSPRFDEAKTLADVIALRTLRCLLWTGQMVLAVRSWIAHRDRVRLLLSRTGEAVQDHAWESRWANVMADLLASRPNPPAATGEAEEIFIDANKTLTTGERLTPWEKVHHEGYWLDLAKSAALAHRAAIVVSAQQPRQPARLTGAEQATIDHSAQNADESNSRYAQDVFSLLDKAVIEFRKRGQLRKIDALELQRASRLIQNGSWEAATSALQQLWLKPHWRRSGWWQLLQGIGWALLDCLTHTSQSELRIKLLWELSNKVFDIKKDVDYDLKHDSTNDGEDGTHISVNLDLDDTLAPLTATFVFSGHDVYVGEPVQCQLTLQSRSHAAAPPLALSEIRVVFEGNLRPVCLLAENVGSVDEDRLPIDNVTEVTFEEVQLTEDSLVASTTNQRRSITTNNAQTATASLLIRPGSTKVFGLRLVPREAGELSVFSITTTIHCDKHTCAATATDFSHCELKWWERQRDKLVARPLGQESNAFNVVNVQPKPPKFRIEAPNLRKSYYVNETIHVDFDFVNDEEDPVSAKVEARMISPLEGVTRVRWADAVTNDTVPGEAGIFLLPARELKDLNPSEKVSASIHITNTVAAVDHEIELVVSYYIADEPETVLKKTFAVDVAVIRPFEANYAFTTRVDDEAWPSFFEPPPAKSDSSTPLGLKHLYTLSTGLFSFATEDIIIEAILLTATKVTGGAVCSSTTGVVRRNPSKAINTTVSDPDEASISATMKPETTELFDFDFTLQKLVLGDRHSVAVDLALEIGWRRHDSDEVNTTVLEAPEFLAVMSEPRVTLNIAADTVNAAGLALHTLMFTIENPSMHFLTFNVSLEASEDFAFSGPKACAVSLVPMSKEILTFRILPNKKDTWIGVSLNVVDAYFGQTLKVLPGGKGVRSDKKGNVFVKV